jgi:hypothetical protein
MAGKCASRGWCACRWGGVAVLGDLGGCAALWLRPLACGRCACPRKSPPLPPKQAIPGLSPVPWWGTLFPLAVVLTVNAVKEAFDDYWRHISDAQVNRRWLGGRGGGGFGGGRGLKPGRGLELGRFRPLGQGTGPGARGGVEWRRTSGTAETGGTWLGGLEGEVCGFRGAPPPHPPKRHAAP